MTRIVLIRHEDGPEDDRVTAWFRARGIAPEVVRPYRGEVLGQPDGVAATVIYGGPFDVNEDARHPFLRDEARWVESCLARETPVLGICQGAQTVARVLGAPVGPPASAVHEFGHYALTPTGAGRALIPDGLVVPQAHYHGFGLPAGAELLARSALYPVQAMRHGTAFALQFHPEVTPAGFRRWQDAEWAPWGQPGAQDRAEQDRLMEAHEAALTAWFDGFLHQLFGPVTEEATRSVEV